MKLVAVLSCFILCLSLAGEEQASAQGRTVLDGVYSEAQAARGKEAYTQGCVTCHMESLRGFFEGGAAPPIIGESFVKGWEAASVLDLFAKLRDTMPKDNADSVDEASKLDILTYLLQMNEFPVGKADLAMDTSLLAGTMVVPLTGLTEPSPGSSVRTVGCLLQTPDKTWVLTSSPAPVRTRGGQPSEGAALETAATQPLGDGTTRLIDVWPSPEAHIGHRMEAKGFLIDVLRQRGGGDLVTGLGINLTSLTMVAENCGN
jgi:mono/diheme cytochrome c family protein